jgi:multiple sugar transport system ATP-binding protein
MAEVTLQNVSKSFGKTMAVEGISMTIEDGAFVVLLGPTGAGKTTTLRLISGLEKLDTGSVHIGGRDVAHDKLTHSADTCTLVVQTLLSSFPHIDRR